MSGTVIGNRYNILRSLGAGGFGETYLAEDTHTPSRRRCVIKKLKPVTGNPQMFQMVSDRFNREAAILEQLGEGNAQIPRLYAYFEEAGQFYLVQEFIEGETLTQRVKSQGVQSEAVVKELLVKILPVLSYVHSFHIIHRDIKPDNIMVRNRDGLPVLIDFGSVKESINTVLNSENNSTPSIVVGTPGFMPPEQSTGRPIYSSDLYALGLTAIYLLTAKIPQQLNTDSRTGEWLWHENAPHLTPSLVAVLDRSIRYHPQDRYTSAQDMLSALQSTAPTPISTPTPANIPLSQQETVAVAPGGPVATQAVPVSRGSNQWLKALLIGGGIGLALALAIVALRAAFRSPAPVAVQTTTASTTKTTIPPAPPRTPQTIPTPATPTISPPTANTPVPQVTPIPQNNQNVNNSPSPQDSGSQPRPVNSPAPEVTSIPQNNQNVNNSPSPQDSGSQPRPVNSPAPEVNSIPQNDQNINVPGLPVGASLQRINDTFGEPNTVRRGVWGNTNAMLYVIEPNKVDLGFIVDRDTQVLRQTEASFAPSVSLEEIEKTVDGMAGGVASAGIKRELRRIKNGEKDIYEFETGNLRGVIERNAKKRIYIAFWDVDLH